MTKPGKANERRSERIRGATSAVFAFVSLGFVAVLLFACLPALKFFLPDMSTYVGTATYLKILIGGTLSLAVGMIAAIAYLILALAAIGVGLRFASRFLSEEELDTILTGFDKPTAFRRVVERCARNHTRNIEPTEIPGASMPSGNEDLGWWDRELSRHETAQIAAFAIVANVFSLPLGLMALCYCKTHEGRMRAWIVFSVGLAMSLIMYVIILNPTTK